MEEHQDDPSTGLPPDIIQSTLKYLTIDDIRNLSLTNKYYSKLLDYQNSDTLWHALFQKAFEYSYTNSEPVKADETATFKSSCERILCNRFPDLSWHDKYNIRAANTRLFTWGYMQHARLGYTATSNPYLNEADMNTFGSRYKYGVNKPIEVPWFTEASMETDFTKDEQTIAQISSGGFSFQILTMSGKIYSTGSTYSSGNRGPGTPSGQPDYDPLQNIVRGLETSFPSLTNYGATPLNFASRVTSTGRPLELPHQDVYATIQELEDKATEYIPGNQNIRRMFTRDSFEIYLTPEGSNGPTDNPDILLNHNHFVAVSSGRCHFIALDTENELYSWDTPETQMGIPLEFDNLPSRATNPILKIACGWNFSCVYIYGIGLVTWNEREPVKPGARFSHAKYTTIKETYHISGELKVLDFACYLDNTVIYITQNGGLWLYSNGSTKQLELPIMVGKPLKVDICYKTLVLFNYESCFTLNLNLPELDLSKLERIDIGGPNENVVSLSGGDYHLMALTDRGNIYSWGHESQISGCLGLGSPQQIIDEQRIGRWNGNRNIDVKKATRIDLPEGMTCLAISAGGWQSGALILKR